MKKYFLLLTGFIVALTTFADKGIIVEQNFIQGTGTKTTVKVTWYITRDNCKLKMIFGDGNFNTTSCFIPDAANMQMLSYNEGEVPADEGGKKTFFATPVSKINAGSEMNFTRITVEKTGETKEIAGFKCEKILVKTNKSETEMWVTVLFKPEFYKFVSFFPANYTLVGLNEGKIKGFPLQAVTKDLNGKVINSYQFVTAKETELNDGEFRVPDGYTNVTQIEKK